METLKGIEEKIREINSNLYNIKARYIEENVILINATTDVLIFNFELTNLEKAGFKLAFIAPMEGNCIELKFYMRIKK